MSADETTSTAPVRVHVTHTFKSPPETVFDTLIRHESYEAFGAKISRVSDGDGVGSTRSLKIGVLPAFQETTMTAERPTLIEYKITKGSPLRRHWGRQELSQTPDGGTHLEYTIRFDMAIPGTAAIVAKILTSAITKGLPQLCE